MNYAEKTVPIFIPTSVAFLVSVDITVMIFAEALCSSRVIILFFFFFYRYWSLGFIMWEYFRRGQWKENDSVTHVG